MTGSIPPSGPLSYEGQVSVPYIVKTFDPLPTNNKFPLPTVWVNSQQKKAFISVSKDLGTTEWAPIGGSPGEVDTLTGNSGGAVGPTASNINLVGTTLYDVIGNPATSTLTITPGSNAYPTTPFVVGPIGNAGYQTIQSALNAANIAGGGFVVVQPGNYTENLTLYNAVHITGLNFADAGGGVNITGMHTPPTSGGFVFNNVRLISANDIFNSTAAGTAHLVLGNAEVFVTNGYTFNLPNWTGKLESFDVNAAVGTNDGYVNNTGGAEVDLFDLSVGSGSTNIMTVSGPTYASGASIYCPMQFVTGSSAEFDGCFFGNSLTLSNNSTGTITTSHIETGSSAAITMSSSAAWTLSNIVINSSNSTAIAGTGAGTLTLGGITFVSNAIIAGTLTVTGAAAFLPAQFGTAGQVFTSNGPGVVPSFQNAGSGLVISTQKFTTSGTYTPTSGMKYCIVEVVGGGGGSGGVATTSSLQYGSSGGGGGGGYAKGIFSAASIGASQTVTIGAGGTAGPAGYFSGGTGGTTSIGSLISATGGTGGQGANSNSGAEANGGNGGSGTGGDLQTTGSPGGMGIWGVSIAMQISGYGGSTLFGGGGSPIVAVTGIPSIIGNAGISYGGGASGSSLNTNQSAIVGAAGAAGVVIITEFSGTGGGGGTDLYTSKFIVSPGGLSDGANYSTIGSAIAAASSGDTIIIQPGTYAENFTIDKNLTLFSFSSEFRNQTQNTIISGNVTISNGATASLFGLAFTTNGYETVSLIGSGTIATFENCFFNALNANAISCTGDSQANLFLENCSGTITGPYALFTTTFPPVFIKNSFFTQTSGTPSASTTSAGQVNLINSAFGIPFATTSSGTIQSYFCLFGTTFSPYQNVTWITTAGSATAIVYQSKLSSGTASCISVGTGTSVSAVNNAISSTNTNVFTGAGTINTGGNVCILSSGNNVSTINHLTTI